MVTVEDGGFIAPGIVGVTDLADLGTGDLVLQMGSTYEAELGDAPISDTIVVTGTVDIQSGAELDIIFHPTFTADPGAPDGFYLRSRTR